MLLCDTVRFFFYDGFYIFTPATSSSSSCFEQFIERDVFLWHCVTIIIMMIVLHIDGVIQKLPSARSHQCQMCAEKNERTNERTRRPTTKWIPFNLKSIKSPYHKRSWAAATALYILTAGPFLARENGWSYITEVDICCVIQGRQRPDGDCA